MPMTRPPDKDKPKADLWLWAFPLLLGVLAYATMFRNGFVWDDATFLVKNATIQRLWPPAWLWGCPGPGAPWLGARPIAALSFALDFALWRLNPWGFHLTSLLLHLLCTLLVVGLGRALFKNSLAAFAAGALFAVHPGHGEAVVAFLGRSDLLATAFCILAALFYLGSWEGKRTTLYWLSAGSFLLGVFSKETALAFLGVLALLEGLRVREGKTAWKAALLQALPFLLVIILYGAFRRLISSGSPPPLPDWVQDPRSLLALLVVAFGEYLRLLLFPLRLSPWQDPVTLQAASGAGLALGALGLALCLGGFLLLWKRDPRGALGLGWLLAGLAPVLLAWFLPLLGLKGLGGLPGPVLAERWLYLPSVGGCLILGWGYGLIRGRAKPWGRALVSLVGMVLLALLVWRQISWTPAWRSEESIARAVIASSPRSALGHAHLGFALWAQGRLPEAEPELRQAVRLAPSYAQARHNLGFVLFLEGKTLEAEPELREALRLDPGNAEAWVHLGDLLLDQNRLPEAGEAYRQAVLARPDYPGAHFNLGISLYAQGRVDEAEGEYRETLRLDPGFAPAYYHLAIVLFRKERKDEAVSALETFLVLDGRPHPEVEALLRQLKGR